MRVWDAVCTSVMVVVGLVPVPGRAQQSVTAFENVAVIPMDRERVMAKQTVVVKGDRIIAMGPAKQVRVPANAVRIDGRGKFLLPGLADMHTHLAYAGAFDTTGNPAVRLADAERQLFLLLANGVTTIRNMDFMGAGDIYGARNHPVLDGPTLLQLKARAASGELWSPRIYTSSKWRLDTTKSVDENVAAYKAAGYDHLKIYEYDPLTPMMHDSLVRIAHRVGMPLVGHGIMGDLPRTLTLGLKSVEHFVPYLGSNPDSLSPLIAATARAGLWNSPTSGMLGMVADGRTRSTSLERRYAAKAFAKMRRLDVVPARDFVASDAAPFERDTTELFARLTRGLQNAGAGLLLGTDMASHLAEPGFTVHRGLQAFVLRGLTPYQALITGTRNVAAYFGTEDSTGTVAVGKRADLLLLAANPLVDIRHTGEIAGVMIGGRWLSRAAIEQRLDATYGR